ncbi:MAG: hypothetical protein DRQ47_02470 [Gammaproteobacteria bacterium]|nr:MAG: hypothetical protein DRQ47_02470 [Gammaproteobacteria bacterium]
MIINKEYFKGEIYIAHAVDSISDDTTGVGTDIDGLIDKYERDCLIKSLGMVLYNEFYDQLDPSSLDGLLPGSDAKWDNLLNGLKYIDPDGDQVWWRGIRYESVTGSGVYDKSFLAEYIYFFYQQSNQVSVGSNGFTHTQSKNSTMADPTPKVISAWREFFAIVQGESTESLDFVTHTKYGTSVDWCASNKNSDVSLYKFIQDQNTLVTDTYADWSPMKWVNMNNFGI